MKRILIFSALVLSAVVSCAQIQDINNGESGLTTRNKLNANFDYLDVVVTASGTNTYTATPSPALASYVTGQRYLVTFTNGNTGASTLNLNSLGARSIVTGGSTALSSGDIPAGQTLLLMYDGTNIKIVGAAGSGGGGGGAVSSVFTRTGAVVAVSGDYTATLITSAAAGNIAATTVQAALNELDTEKQVADADLTTIGGLSPSNDDIIQRKSGAWTNRTMAQLKTDLALVKGDVGLGNVDNTSDANKPVSTAQQTAIDAKVTDGSK
jgi:hypothetical protein